MRLMQRQISLTALFSTPSRMAPWKPGQELPKRVDIFSLGDNDSSKGIFRITPATAERFSDVQRRFGHRRCALDFEHNTVPGTPAFKEAKEPRDIAATFTPFLGPAGLSAEEIEYTKLGKEKAENFTGFSPAPYHLDDGTVVGLHSMAFVRAGAMGQLAFCSVVLDDIAKIQTLEDEEMKDLLAALTAAKLTPENADEKALAELLTNLAGRLVVIETGLTGLSAEKLGEMIAAKLQPLSAEISGLKTAGLNTERQHMLELAKFEGKVVTLSAETIAKLSPEELKAEIAKVPVTVPLDQRTKISPLGAEGAKAAGPTPQQIELAAICGVDAKKVQWPA